MIAFLSFAVALSVSKGRGSSYGMLQSTRRVAALLFAANVGLHLRWLPSEWNPANEPSRYFDDDGNFPTSFVRENDKLEEERHWSRFKR